MTDNRTTELRAKLTEHGIEYETNDHMGAFETRWNGFTAMQLTPSAKLIMTVTPDQAIAATLGNGTCEQVLTDCDNGLIPPFTAHCSACGAEWGFTPKYCNNCGAKVTGTRDERKAVER